MAGDEAPAATGGGVNGETECDRKDPVQARRLTESLGAVRPASLLRKSILDETSGHLRRLAALQHSNHVPVLRSNIIDL
jgi:hypothetical protein